MAAEQVATDLWDTGLKVVQVVEDFKALLEKSQSFFSNLRWVLVYVLRFIGLAAIFPNMRTSNGRHSMKRHLRCTTRWAAAFLTLDSDWCFVQLWKFQQEHRCTSCTVAFLTAAAAAAAAGLY